ncbi:MAG: hypothetical protein FWH36_05690 [Lentimicrobiaceae bacterium]|nr:hypothetical protein [Lentimicrobiaceae bacterium]
MKRFFYVAMVAAVVFAANSCKEPDDDGDEVVVVTPTEDSSGLCTIIFKNVDGASMSWNLYLDETTTVKEYMLGQTSHIQYNVQAGTHKLQAIQVGGHLPGQGKSCDTIVKILTDSVFTWQFP